MLQEVVGEMSDLQDEAEIQVLMDRISRRLKEVDVELWNTLVKYLAISVTASLMKLQTRIGLDPSLPHFSYRWLGPMFAYTLPIDALFVIWDSIFSKEPRTSDTNHKLNCIVEVAVSMLICAKPMLLLMV
jgi:hypothetical protein